MGYFEPSCFGPELFQFVDLFSLNRRRGKQLTSFRVGFLKTKRSQFRVSFNVEHVFFFSKFLKVIGFRDIFFLGGGGGAGGPMTS